MFMRRRPPKCTCQKMAFAIGISEYVGSQKLAWRCFILGDERCMEVGCAVGMNLPPLSTCRSTFCGIHKVCEGIYTPFQSRSQSKHREPNFQALHHADLGEINHSPLIVVPKARSPRSACCFRFDLPFKEVGLHMPLPSEESR